eukprot:TRINITY_DN9079_c0_g2_i1.p1 TRINITY_DN9079_c0_g2~~TRINITY_DN9079_c0_g2_i1.p1  ORF type:complete len:819 (+),score=227.33 TRINITY_DN9079_c0_g2_i1:152-2608(+)
MVDANSYIILQRRPAVPTETAGEGEFKKENVMSTQLAGIPKRPDERIGKEPVFVHEMAPVEDEALDEANSDENLCCPLCEKTFDEASIVPCCQETFCDSCIRTHLLEHGMICPSCRTKLPSLDILQPNISVRKSVQRRRRSSLTTQTTDLKASSAQHQHYQNVDSLTPDMPTQNVIEKHSSSPSSSSAGTGLEEKIKGDVLSVPKSSEQSEPTTTGTLLGPPSAKGRPHAPLKPFVPGARTAADFGAAPPPPANAGNPFVRFPPFPFQNPFQAMFPFLPQQPPSVPISTPPIMTPSQPIPSVRPTLPHHVVAPPPSRQTATTEKLDALAPLQNEGDFPKERKEPEQTLKGDLHDMSKSDAEPKTDSSKSESGGVRKERSSSEASHSHRGRISSSPRMSPSRRGKHPYLHHGREEDPENVVEKTEHAERDHTPIHDKRRKHTSSPVVERRRDRKGEREGERGRERGRERERERERELRRSEHRRHDDERGSGSRSSRGKDSQFDYDDKSDRRHESFRSRSPRYDRGRERFVEEKPHRRDDRDGLERHSSSGRDDRRRDSTSHSRDEHVFERMRLREERRTERGMSESVGRMQREREAIVEAREQKYEESSRSRRVRTERSDGDASWTRRRDRHDHRRDHRTHDERVTDVSVPSSSTLTSASTPTSKTDSKKGRDGMRKKRHSRDSEPSDRHKKQSRVDRKDEKGDERQETGIVEFLDDPSQSRESEMADTSKKVFFSGSSTGPKKHVSDAISSKTTKKRDRNADVVLDFIDDGLVEAGSDGWNDIEQEEEEHSTSGVSQTHSRKKRRKRSGRPFRRRKH